MSKVSLSSTQHILLKLLSCSINKTKLSLKDFDEWDSVVLESAQQTVSAIALDGADEADVPQDILEVWRAFVLKSIALNLKVTENHGILHKIMQGTHIPYCILKGCASGSYYPDPTLRTMGDVDFLVDKTDVEKASESLKQHGYMPRQGDHPCHIVFTGKSAHIELHFEPAGIPDGANGELIRSYFSDIFEKASYTKDELCEYVKPHPFHHGLILTLHTYHHMLGEGIGLRHLCDFALFANSLTDSEFRSLFEEKLKAVGLWHFVQIIGQTSHVYLDTEYKSWMGEIDRELCFDVIQDIFSGGNFGRKDSNRVNQGALISDRGKNGIKNNKLSQMIHSMNVAAYYQFPVLKKHKTLKPFGWIFLGTRYSFRVVCGKRAKIPVKGIALQAERRKAIYKQFHLFETDNTQEV